VYFLKKEREEKGGGGVWKAGKSEAFSRLYLFLFIFSEKKRGEVGRAFGSPEQSCDKKPQNYNFQ